MHRARQHCSKTLLAPLSEVPEAPACGAFRRRIDAWTAGELSEEEATEVAAHVSNCEWCHETRERSDVIRSAWALVPFLAWSVRLPALDSGVGPSLHHPPARPSRLRLRPGRPDLRSDHSRLRRHDRLRRSIQRRRALLGESAHHATVAALALALAGAGSYGLAFLGTNTGPPHSFLRRTARLKSSSVPLAPTGARPEVTTARSAGSGPSSKPTLSLGRWADVPSPTTATLNSVSCVPVTTSSGTTTSYCYAVGDNGTILFSDDGGLAWTSEASPTRADLRGISCYQLSIAGLHVPVACWAVGDNGTILFEKNGLAWVATSTTPATTQPFEAVACQANGQRCWAVGFAVAAEFDSSLFPSTGWGLITILGPPGTQCGPGGPQNACLRGVALGNTDEHFAVGGGGNIFAQFDYHGQSWSNQLSLGAGYFTSIACFPGTLAGRSRCITVGSDASLVRDRIELTSNSGSSWLPAASPAEASLPVLRGVAVLHYSTALAFSVGDGGTILRTLDAGTTWSRETSPTKAGLEAVSCPNTSSPRLVCVAVGQGGTVLVLS